MIMTEHLETVGQNGQPIESTLSTSPHTLLHDYRMHFLQANEIGDCYRYQDACFRVLRTW